MTITLFDVEYGIHVVSDYDGYSTAAIATPFGHIVSSGENAQKAIRRLHKHINWLNKHTEKEHAKKEDSEICG